MAEKRYSMKGVLPHQEIEKLIPTVIVRGDPGYIRTASYDMRVGDQYYLHDEHCPDGHAMRSRGQGVIVIPPNGLLMCTMHEELKFPPDIVGHLSLKVPLLMKGVMMASQSQIDAGYEGKIFGMLYNLSQRDVCLREGDPVLKLEMIRLETATAKPYDNSISRTATLQRFIDAPLISSLVKIREDAKSAVSEVRDAKDKLSYTQVIAVLGVTTLGIIGSAHFASDSTVQQLAQKVAVLEDQSKMSETISQLRSRVDELEKQNKALEIKLVAPTIDSQSGPSKDRIGSNDVNRKQPSSADSHQ
jgi:deoxycytidine triphosphate deaminase